MKKRVVCFITALVMIVTLYFPALNFGEVAASASDDPVKDYFGASFEKPMKPIIFVNEYTDFTHSEENFEYIHTSIDIWFSPAAKQVEYEKYCKINGSQSASEDLLGGLELNYCKTVFDISKDGSEWYSEGMSPEDMLYNLPSNYTDADFLYEKGDAVFDIYDEGSWYADILNDWGMLVLGAGYGTGGEPTAAYINFNEYTLYIRCKNIIEYYNVNSEEYCYIESPWSDVASYGKDGDNTVPAVPYHMDVPVLSDFSFVYNEDTGEQELYVYATMPETWHDIRIHYNNDHYQVGLDGRIDVNGKGYIIGEDEEGTNFEIISGSFEDEGYWRIVFYKDIYKEGDTLKLQVKIRETNYDWYEPPIHVDASDWSEPIVIAGASESCEHDFEAIMVEDEWGWHTIKCKKCNFETWESHDYTEYVVTQAATCTTPGNKTRTCKKCGYVDNTELPTDDAHDWGNYEKVDEEKCKRICKLCFAEDEVIHIFNIIVPTEDSKPATCKEDGLEVRRCDKCNFEKTFVLPRIEEHVYDSACDTTCNICGDVREAQPHQWGETYTRDKDNHWIECKECYEKKDIKAHDFTIFEAKDNQIHECKCKDCGYTKTENHTFDEKDDVVKTAATCIADGILVRTCTKCGKEVEESIPKSDAHDYTDVAWTAKDAEKHTRKCKLCDQSVEEEHKFGQAVITKAATCTEEGSRQYTCASCGYVKNEPIQKIEHTYGSPCDETCDICGFVRNDAAQHNWKEAWITDSIYHWHECAACGAVKDKEAHKPGPEATLESAQYCTVCTYMIHDKLTESPKEVTGKIYFFENSPAVTVKLYAGTYSDADIKADMLNGMKNALSYEAETGELKKDSGMYYVDYNFTGVTDGYYKVAVFKNTQYLVAVKEISVIDGISQSDITMHLYGDLNDSGAVDAADLTILARHVAKIEILSGVNLEAANVDFNDEVTASDLTTLARYVAKIITVFG